jgi:large subunit ribosomal protein L37Ae
MPRTKKVGSAGKFGSRYGLKIRKKIVDIEKSTKVRHKCPSCLRKSLKRKSAGIWECRKCGIKMAGGAYSPKTSATKLMKEIILE